MIKTRIHLAKKNKMTLYFTNLKKANFKNQIKKERGKHLDFLKTLYLSF